MATKDPKCEDCEHWERKPPEITRQDNHHYGYCHRFPRKEITHHQYWCIEFVPKKG